MFDRSGNFIRYETEEQMMRVLMGDQLKPDLPTIFKNAMVVDAASHGWHKALDYMIQEMGFSPDGHDHKNYTPLGYAAMMGQTSTVKKLVEEYDVSVYTRNNFGRSMFNSEEWFDGYTAFNYALQDDNYAICYFLISQPDIDLDDFFPEKDDDSLDMLEVVWNSAFDVEVVKQRLEVLMSERARTHWSKVRSHLIQRRIGWYWMQLPSLGATQDNDLQEAVDEWGNL